MPAAPHRGTPDAGCGDGGDLSASFPRTGRFAHLPADGLDHFALLDGYLAGGIAPPLRAEMTRDSRRLTTAVADGGFREWAGAWES